MLLAGFVGGAAWALLPAWLRAWHGVSEIITTLMLNYVAILWVNYLVYGPWKDPAGHNFPISPRFPDNATFARMGDGQLHTGLFVPIVAAAVLVFVLSRTRWGYELRVVGENPEAARYAGINVRWTMLTAMLVSGGMAGVAGMVQIAGIIHLLNGQLSSNYGYTAIIIAWLAQLHPVAVLVVGGAVRSAGQRRLRRFSGGHSAGTWRGAAGHDPVLRAGHRRRLYTLPTAHRQHPDCRRSGRARADGHVTGELLIAICLAAIASGTSILLPALGEALTERSGVQNLGVEGMMLMGALFGYIVDIETENIGLAFAAAIVAAMSLALVHAFLVGDAARQSDRQLDWQSRCLARA